MKVAPLEKRDEEQFLKFLYRDEIRHVFTIYDLKYDRNKTQIWIATKNREMCGYLF